MKIAYLFVLFVLILSIGLVVNGCANQNKTTAIQKCVNLCKEKQDINMSNGPCLSNNITSDWVCDIAHNPRQDIDNLPENQCEAFRQGKAHHFVELDENCNIIRVY